MERVQVQILTSTVAGSHGGRMALEMLAVDFGSMQSASQSGRFLSIHALSLGMAAW